ncbi:hypothetical protein [Chromobacterium subtsugae]|uniref:hypothetical protein n=1 Tax=Chromobacterium subtsugae TaxID=251747 RepID=UPI000AD9EC98|nr:hypothetical protein [Chromobacterium subtsugae]
MSISAADLLNFAEEYVPAAKMEVEYRMVASRAYYAVYHACKDYRDNAPVVFPLGDGRGGVHAELYSSFMNATPAVFGAKNIAIKKLGAFANGQLKSARVSADYCIGDAFGASDATDMIEKAKKAFRMLEAL